MFKRNPATTLALAAALGLAVTAPTVANEALTGAFGGASGITDLRISLGTAQAAPTRAAPVYNVAAAAAPSRSAPIYNAPAPAVSAYSASAPVHTPYSGVLASVQTTSPAAAAAPSASQKLDMSGADGSLRACYANGGMAQQGADLSYVCNYEPVTAEASPHITPPDVETGYFGTANALDATIQDCIVRGGSLAQLTNQNYVCVM